MNPNFIMGFLTGGLVVGLAVWKLTAWIDKADKQNQCDNCMRLNEALSAANVEKKIRQSQDRQMASMQTELDVLRSQRSQFMHYREGGL